MNNYICFWNFRNTRHEIYVNNTFTCLLCINVQFNIMQKSFTSLFCLILIQMYML